MDGLDWKRYYVWRRTRKPEVKDVTLVNERSHTGSMVLASNRSPKDWYPLFPNPVLAEGILDRLVNKAHHVVLTGRSYRTQLKPEQTDPVAEGGE